MSGLAEAWRARGDHRTLCGHQIFTVDVPSRSDELWPPLLVLHGFPTSSFDFQGIVDRLASHRRVLLFDMLGYGLSDKPDRAYDFSLQADIAEAFLADVGVDRLGLLTHDVGDTLGGELLARQLEGTWAATVTDRTMANGSIYHEMARLSVGQEFLLALPDQRLAPEAGIDRATVLAGIAATFSPAVSVSEEEEAGQWEMIAHHDGQLLLPRLIRYIEERRAHEGRFTGAIEAHASPLEVVWGVDDPIAVVAMTTALCRDRGDIGLHLLDGVGHYPMVEAPDRFLAALGWARP